MSNLRQMKKPTRLMAALIALCYLWLSTVTSLQHTHGPGDDAEETPVVAASLSAGNLRPASIRSHSAAEKHTVVSRQTTKRCVACEWEAANVSPALPAFVFRFTSPIANRAITTFPRYLQCTALVPASRGPPVA